MAFAERYDRQFGVCTIVLGNRFLDSHSHLRGSSRSQRARDSRKEEAMPAGSHCRPAEQLEEFPPRESLSAGDEKELRLLQTMD
jgi:hypothetical protein